MIYATKDTGELLWSKDANRDGTGHAGPPSAIGHGGWDSMLWVLAGA
jgi:hypothetical protein